MYHDESNGKTDEKTLACNIYHRNRKLQCVLEVLKYTSMNQHKYSPTAKTMRKQAMKESSYSQQIHQEYNSMADLTLKINRSRQMLIQFNCLCFKLCFTTIRMIVYILHLPSLSLSHAHPHTNTLSLFLTHTYNFEHPLTHTHTLSLSLTHSLTLSL